MQDAGLVVSLLQQKIPAGVEEQGAGKSPAISHAHAPWQRQKPLSWGILRMTLPF
jgi:hypothetical protein